MKYYIIGVIVVIILVTGCLYLFLGKKDNKKELKDLTSLRFHYTSGYAMYAYTTYEIKYDNKYTITIKPYGIPDEEAKTYDISEEEINKILNVLNKYNVIKWDGFSKSNKDVLDGDSFSFSAYFKDGRSISAHGYVSYPNNYGDVKKELIEIFENGRKEL